LTILVCLCSVLTYSACVGEKTIQGTCTEKL